MEFNNVGVNLNLNNKQGSDLSFIVNDFDFSITNIIFTASIYNDDLSAFIPFTITKESNSVNFLIRWNDLKDLPINTAYQWSAQMESGNGLISPLFEGEYRTV